jgi:hypothetical protein
MFVFVSTMAASQQLQWEEEEADHAGKSYLFPSRYCYSSFIAAVKDTKADNIIMDLLSSSFLVIIKEEFIKVAVKIATTVTMVK